jgi:hypothetical protein
VADTLSLFCVTKGEACVLPLLREQMELAVELGCEWVLGLDGPDALACAFIEDFGKVAKLVAVHSDGYLESVHDTVLAACGGDYVFRLDDDETPSMELRAWLARKGYTAHRHWRFPRQHLWETPQQFIANAPLWPDDQTRLSARQFAGGRTTVHAASPFGKGIRGQGTILHHKFLLRDLAERVAIAARYEAVKPGAGTGKFLAFAAPELAIPSLDLRAVAENAVVA